MSINISAQFNNRRVLVQHLKGKTAVMLVCVYKCIIIGVFPITIIEVVYERTKRASGSQTSIFF